MLIPVYLLLFAEHSTVQCPSPFPHLLESIAEEIQEKPFTSSMLDQVNNSQLSPKYSSLPSSVTAITLNKDDIQISVKGKRDDFSLPDGPNLKSIYREDISNTSPKKNSLPIGSNNPLVSKQAGHEAMNLGEVSPAARNNALKTVTAPLFTVQSPPKMQASKMLVDKDLKSSLHPVPKTPICRAKSEGQVKSVSPSNEYSPVPEISINATITDCLWSKLDPSSHRDSVSSSSSISSNDTVIDLSLPNLARKSLTCLRAARDCPDSQGLIVGNWGCPPRSATTTANALCVSKSKSNPNLRNGEMCDPVLESPSRHLGSEHDAKWLMQRRHTWSKLYIEGLKQSSLSPKKAPSALPKEMDNCSKSKSLGDLTSDDIVSHFDSKYRSISRSFVIRPNRQQRSPKKSQDDLTERLKILTDVEPLTSKDFASSHNDSTAEEKEDEHTESPPLRRSSSRSQSRVRYIANRARQAQERQRLQGLVRTFSSPIEERGIPEGACSIPRSPCTSLDLLSQLPPVPPQQSPHSPDTDVFFMLRL